jgi:hypothetical protein
MKHLMKFAVGAAIAGALVNLLLKQQRSGRGMERNEGASPDQPEPSFGQGSYGQGEGENIPRGSSGYTVAELIADESSVGEGSGDDRVQLPEDGRVGRGPLNS